MEIAITSRPTDWVIIISLLSAVLLVWIRSFDTKRMAFFIAFPWQPSAADFALHFNSDHLNYRADRFLLIVGWILSPLLILALRLPFVETGLQFYGWADYFRVLLLSGFFIVFKLFMASIVGYVFQVQEALIQGQNISLAYFTWLSIFGAFASLAVYFSNLPFSVIYILWFSLSLGLLWVLLRSIAFSFSLGLVASYIILYLCALEIIPLLYLFFLS